MMSRVGEAMVNVMKAVVYRCAFRLRGGDVSCGRWSTAGSIALGVGDSGSRPLLLHIVLQGQSLMRCLQPIWPSTARCARRGAVLLSLGMAGPANSEDLSGGLAGWFFVEKCPLEEQCSQQAWKRASVWGPTVEICHQKLERHLRMSGIHLLSREDAESMVAVAEVKFFEGEYEPDGDARPPRKKPRHAPRGGASEPSRDERLIRRTIETVMGQSASQVAASSSALAPRAPPGGTITLRVTELQTAIDCTSRALHAAQQAHRLCVGAARAFSDEASALQGAHDNLRSILSAASSFDA